MAPGIGTTSGTRTSSTRTSPGIGTRRTPGSGTRMAPRMGTSPTKTSPRISRGGAPGARPAPIIMTRPFPPVVLSYELVRLKNRGQLLELPWLKRGINWSYGRINWRAGHIRVHVRGEQVIRCAHIRECGRIMTS